MSPITKRAHDGLDAEPEYSEAKSARPNEAHPSHPYYILEHLVRYILPGACKKDAVKEYYQKQLDDPNATIKECKSLVAQWVLEMWEKATLWKHDKLKQRATSDFPSHGTIYMSLLVVEGLEFRYVGQSIDCKRRIAKEHESVSHRQSHPSLFYFLRDRTEEAHYLILVDNKELQAGPLLNILEQWMSLMFCALQPPELKHNLAIETLRWIPSDELHKGANAREPLAQGFDFGTFPMRGQSFRYSPISLKREWYDFNRHREIVIRSELFLRGDIFEGSFWNAPGWYHGDYEFQIWSVKLLIGKSWIDRCDINTIRIWCDLRPEGEVHPHGITRCSGVRREYNDPALRLGIRVSGTRNGDGQTGWCWLIMDSSADKGTPRLNRLVDWLEGRDPEELRPRRYYPANKRLGRPYCGYTQHPLDVGDRWAELLSLDKIEAARERFETPYTQEETPDAQEETRDAREET